MKKDPQSYEFYICHTQPKEECVIKIQSNNNPKALGY